MINLINLYKAFIDYEYIIEAFLQAILMWGFFRSFLDFSDRINMQFRKFIKPIGIILYCVLWVLLSNFCDTKRWSGVLAVSLVEFIYIIFCLEGAMKFKLILYCFWYSLYLQCVCISFSIFYKVNQYVVGVVGNIINKLVQNMPEDVYFKITIIQLIYILPFVVYITVTYIILHICFNFVKKFFNYRNCNFNTASIFIVLLPDFLGDLIAAMIFGIIILSNDNTKIIYEIFPSLVYIIPAISFCIIVTVILQIYLLNKKILLDEEEGNKMILSNQIDMMKNHLTEIENLYSGIRGIRHDLANHIDNLRYLIKYKNNENADFYMNKMTEAIEKFDFKIKTGNPITDVVVNRKYNILKGKNIKFKSEFYFDEK